MIAKRATPGYYSVRGNRTFTTASLHLEDGTPVDNEDDAYWAAGEQAYLWGEPCTILFNEKPIGQVLPGPGF